MATVLIAKKAFFQSFYLHALVLFVTKINIWVLSRPAIKVIRLANLATSYKLMIYYIVQGERFSKLAKT